MSTKPVTKFITIASLILNAGTQFRAKLDSEAVDDYTKRLEEWREFNLKDKEGKAIEPAPSSEKWTKPPLPAITVIETEEGLINVDGFHRVKAATKAGFEVILAEVRTGTKEDAIKFALKANASHGVRLTNDDKQKKLKAALKIPEFKELSNNSLAKEICVSESFVRANRPAAPGSGKVVAVTKDGKKRTVKTANIGKGKKGKGKKGDKKDEPAAGVGGGTGNLGAGPNATPNADGTVTFTEGENSEDSGSGTPPPAADKKFDEKTEEAITKIVRACSQITDGAKLDSAIRSGSMSHLATKDIRDFAQTSEDRIRLAYPLVFGDNRMKPKNAFAILDREPDGDTKLNHLFNTAVAHGGAVLEKLKDGFTVLVFQTESFELSRNLVLKSFLIHPNGSRDQVLSAISDSGAVTEPEAPATTVEPEPEASGFEEAEG